ncbi:acetyltransferase, GNAT family [Ancylostoma caninum]|uniref:N-alpha-acetyltransferase 60 n=1 Tax=Ancylostoma caninum TaxID=29170 RepID=A0A368F744_ANCCA|nr:acetyltransferase, GNAT family [Ancylostoma caninum]
MSAYPPDIAYREPTIDDFCSLRELGQQCLPLPYPDSYWMRIASDTSTHYSLGAYDQQRKLVGAIGVIRCVGSYFTVKLLNAEEQKLISTYKKVCYITTLIVAPAYRKIGIATQLLQRASTVLLQEGSQLIYLHVLHTNVPAIRLYEKMGYEKVAEIPDYYTIDGGPQAGLLYCRRLAKPVCYECLMAGGSNCTIS